LRLSVPGPVTGARRYARDDGAWLCGFLIRAIVCWKYVQVKDLEAEKQGVQEALKAALLMLSERFSHNPSAQNAHSNTVPASKPDIVTPRLESVAVSSVCCVRLLLLLCHDHCFVVTFYVECSWRYNKAKKLCRTSSTSSPPWCSNGKSLCYHSATHRQRQKRLHPDLISAH
jgi:hypothetical protein